MISVYSTYAIDVVFKDGAETIQKGGPLYFIENALRNAGVSYESHYGPDATIEIIVANGAETGKIKTKPKYQNISDADQSKVLLVSTIFNEWGLDNIRKLKGKVILDIQGYVRNPDVLGGKKSYEFKPEVLEKIYCLKATKQELDFLPPDQVEDQKQRMLIVTDGKNDIEVFESSKSMFFKVEGGKEFSDTIGAGDTFLANVALGIHEKKNNNDLVTNAINKTLDFLNSKQ